MDQSLSSPLENKPAAAPGQAPFLTTGRPLTLLAFIRESSPQQTRREKYGPRQQWRDIRNFALSWPGGPHKVPEDLTITVVERATKWERPEWVTAVQKGIALFKAGAVDAFLFGRVDRESRNIFSSAPILRQAIDAGVQIYFAQEGFRLDPRDQNSLNQYQQEVAKASDYIAKFVKLARGGRFSRAEDDQKLPSNSKIFGFDVIDGKRVPNIPQASALNQAVDIAIQEGSSGPAARWLNEKGWETTMGKPFTTTTLAGNGGLFRNTALIGETVVHFQEGPVTIYHQGIMDSAKFATLNAILDRYQGKLRAQRSLWSYHALSGVNFCRCGARYETVKSRDKFYYRCAKGCGQKSMLEDKEEAAIWWGLADWFQHREERLHNLELVSQSAQEKKQQLLRLRHEREKLEGAWKHLLNQELYNKDEGYPREIVADAKRELWAKTEAIDVAEAKLKSELKTLPSITPEDLERTLQWWGRPWEACLEPTPGQGTLSLEQRQQLRPYLLRVGARITVEGETIWLGGSLPVVTKQDSPGAS